jgi:phosphopantothenoylcysteine decarboxylase/phosphopantothenate--cysteine ligase
MSLKGKKIIVGITGSIAAYKMAITVRLMVKAGAEVKVIMTDAATRFITPLTLSTLSKSPVLSALSEDAQWSNHVELGLWADAFLIAPASANSLSKLANGACDNLLTAVYLSARCPVFVAPAMDVDMWHHPSTQRNIQTLQQDKVRIIPVGKGELASGLNGEGRMAEPEELLQYLDNFFTKGPLQGKQVLINAGPTQEDIDPVRYISNHSSGKMGIALAEAAARMGAKVVLVLGPTTIDVKNSAIEVVKVRSAAQMYSATMKFVSKSQLIICSAAVADYTPKTVAQNKIKKTEKMEIALVKTKDILADIGKKISSKQYLVGFALETNDEENYAKEKLKRKNAHLIVMNSLRNPNAGFGVDTNEVTLFDKNGESKTLTLKSKAEIANEILVHISTKMKK